MTSCDSPGRTELRERIVAIVGDCIPDLVVPVKLEARLRQDLGLSDSDREKIERSLEAEFGVSAFRSSAGWYRVIDVALFVELRLRRQKRIESLDGELATSDISPEEMAFRRIAPHCVLPLRRGAEGHGGNVAIYDALGLEIAIIGEWSGMTDKEAESIADLIVTAVNSKGGVTQTEVDSATTIDLGELA